MSDPLTELDALPLTRGENLTNLQAHILAEQARHPNASGTLSWILSALSFSGRVISAKVRRARIQSVLGTLDSENVQGETQQKLDVISNETLLRCLGTRAGVAIVASEENEEPIVLRRNHDGERPYVVLFDPLDGSSNIDTGGAVGTIFSVLRYDRRAPEPNASLLQRGAEQVAAGYILYGSSTILVLTTGNGVSMFVLDPSIGSFLLVADQLKIPKTGKIYSCNEGNRLSFPALSRLGPARGLLDALLGHDGGGRAPHLVERWRVPVPTDQEGPGRQVALAVRRQSDGHDHRTGGGQGLRRTCASDGTRSERHSPTHQRHHG
jgi:Fructose-1-6-bisphosphatase, N-terminal domain